ncbi:hypothetical protein FNY88_10840 [Corynebacterium guaraldiae]|uniref:ABC-three component systems C-terminal domain-containing protein n=1 Tax=Corynebacterium guaraldiae TaxID=3051103 RepID=A0ABY3CRN2_9CORY|nr:ABC-three component system protein [Corynebacterium guaraldiae]TRX47074.1 hypothetical protein FNY88_10840 [Corynebacterium guaraldiae]TRX53605.1 hypothetical protein FNY91_04010 [Corynebacterium guaraldiae]
MKFYELAMCLAPALPGGLARAERMRELISMFTTVTEDEWGTRSDPAELPSDSVLESMASRSSGFTKKLATAICARLNINAFIERLEELDLATQELITTNIEAYGEQVDLENFAYSVAELLVAILHERAGLSNKTAAELRRAKIHAALTKNRDLLLTRSRGCANCGTPLRTESYDASQASYEIVYIDDATDQFGPDDFAVMCKTCGERFNLAHTDADLAQLRAHNQSLNAASTVDKELAPLGLDRKISQLLSVINQLPFEEAVRDTDYSVMTLQQKIDDMALLRLCFDAMATYEPVVRNTAKALEAQGDFKFSRMRRQIQSAWDVLEDSGMSQFAMWQRLTDWIHENTKVDQYACGVVVAFMIQICDLFTLRPTAVSA